MTLDELMRVYQRRLDDAVPGELVPVEAAFRRLLGELALVEQGSGIVATYINTAQAARRLGLTSKTVANYCEQGKFAGARKSGDNGGGRWMIPVSALEQFLKTRGLA